MAVTETIALRVHSQSLQDAYGYLYGSGNGLASRMLQFVPKLHVKLRPCDHLLQLATRSNYVMHFR